VHCLSALLSNGEDSQRPVPHCVLFSHTRSEVVVAAPCSHSIAVQTVSSPHSRLLVVVPACTCHWPSEHASYALHTRSEVAVVGVCSHCAFVQVVYAMHLRSELAVGAVRCH
jgi:hypothetical protein